MRALKKKKSGIVGGLALHTDSLRYIEMKQEGMAFKVVRQEYLPLAPNCIVKESVQQFGLLENAFVELKNVLGRISCPVVMGVPARDIMMRLINYPQMPLDDVRGALSNEFDGYFPYVWEEAVADLAEVDVPTAGQSDMTILVATSRKTYIDDLLNAATRAGITINGLEPMNVAFFRAICGRDLRNRRSNNNAYLIIGVEPDVTNIILGWHDNGILYRSTLASVNSTNPNPESLLPIVQDVQNTMIFAGNQYRGLQIQQLVLGGSFGQNAQLKMMLETGAQLEVSYSDAWNSWQIHNDLDNIPGFETAIGLALHELSSLGDYDSVIHSIKGA